MRLIQVLGPLMLIALSGCLNSRGSPDALADALDSPLRRCAGALAGDDMPTAREQCLPVVAIYEAATRR